MMNNNKHIAVTYSRDLINDLGGYDGFHSQFHDRLNADDNAYWLTSITGIPGRYGDMVGHYCYIIAENKILYRAMIGMFKDGGHYDFDDGRFWVFSKKVMVLTAPIIKAPEEIHMRGFQGFRYVDQLF